APVREAAGIVTALVAAAAGISHARARERRGESRRRDSRRGTTHRIVHRSARTRPSTLEPSVFRTARRYRMARVWKRTLAGDGHIADIEYDRVRNFRTKGRTR